ncbi:MAG: aldehyde dehydrogenase family protein, partial [Rubricoccaceae bacterium]
VLRFAAPALLLGNTVVLKHAPNTFGCAEALAALAGEAGFGPDALLHFPVHVDAVAGAIADARVAGVTLTGSERAGRAVAEAAGRALKPSVLELGGSDPFVVLADADLERAVAVGVKARVQNNGQSCIAAKRFIVEAPVAEAFAARFAEAMAALRVGDPHDEVHDLGPLARADLRETVHDQVLRAVAEGARLLTGGTLPEGPGFYYPPTVLAGVNEHGLPFREEIFGPVAAITVARDAEDALRLANATRFGLGGAVFTADAARGERFARALRCGSAFVNAMTQSHPAMPFGGVGDSGYGRELGPEGLYAFANVKTLWVEG